MPRKPPRARAALFGAFLAAFGLAVMEAAGWAMFYAKHGDIPPRFAARHYRGPEHHYLTDHPYLPYIAAPGAAGGLSFNSLGDRGPEPERPKRRVRVLCFGGSTTFDGVHPWEDTWPGRLQKLLGARYEVINAAQNGATTADTLVNYALIHSHLDADFVLAYEGTNDLESSFFAGFKTDYSHRRRDIGVEPYPVFRALPAWLDWSALVVSTRWALVGSRGDLHALYSRPGWYDFDKGPFGLPVFRRNLAHLNALAAANGARLVLGTFQYYEPWARERFGPVFAEGWGRGNRLQNEIVRELARREPNVLLAEVERSFSPTPAEMIDFCHLTERGNELVARAFQRAVTRAPRRRG